MQLRQKLYRRENDCKTVKECKTGHYISVNFHKHKNIYKTIL